MEREIITLTPEQQKCADYRSTIAKDLVIQGIAGSGKSTVLMKRAQSFLTDRFVAGRSNQVIIFTYNNTLANYIKEYIQKKFPIDSTRQSEITVTTLDSFLSEVFKFTPGRFARFPLDDRFRKGMMRDALANHKAKYGTHRFHSIEVDFWIDECKWMMNMNISEEDEASYLVMPRAGRGGKVRMSSSDRVVAFQIYREYIAVLKEKKRCEFEEQHLYLSHNLHRISDRYKYDHVLIDEAQDQSLTKMMIVAALSKSDVTISMDMNQRIYKQSWTLSQLGLKSVTKTLKTGFRCSPQNDALAESLRLHNPDADPDHGAAQGKDYGWLPIIKTCKSEVDQNRYFINTIKNWMKTDPQATIGVLYLTNKFGVSYGERLTDNGIPYQKIASNEVFSAISPGVKLATIHSAKGLEFDHVILLDFNEGVIPNIRATDPELANEELVKFRNLAYVAITRAKGRLLICTYDKPSRFIKEMDRKLYLVADPDEGQKQSSTTRSRPADSSANSIPTYTSTYSRDEVEDNVTITAIVQETNKQTTINVDLKKYPMQKSIIGKKVGETFKFSNISLTYKITYISGNTPRTVLVTPATKTKAVNSKTTALTDEEIKQINDFFEDEELSDCFIELFSHQCSICEDICFIDRGTIIGFGREGEHLRAYVGKAKDGSLFLKMKTIIDALSFDTKNCKLLKQNITKNNEKFEKDIDKYTLNTEATTPKATMKKPSESSSKVTPPKPKTLKEFFESKGFQTLDLRSNNGCLWVIGDKSALEPYVNEAIKTFSAYGAYGTGRAISYRPAWWTKSNK